MFKLEWNYLRVALLVLVKLYRHSWVKLAIGSQAEARDEKSLAGHDGQHSEDAEYDEVTVLRLHCFLL